MSAKLILGAISGDVIGSVFEGHNVKTTDFNLFSARTRFTDDSVLTVATMDALLQGGDYAETYQCYGRRHKGRGYGKRFRVWLNEDHPQPYNSYGNGSAMRVSPVGWRCDTLEATLAEAEKSAACTHNHPEGIKGAQATAAAIFLARTGKSKNEIKQYVADTFHYDLNRTCDEIRPHYHFDSSCQGTVPQAVIVFLESADFENAIRLAVSLGGDSDTLACITGGIAEAFYGYVPDEIADKVKAYLSADMLRVVEEFSWRWGEKA
jgi:ADP-ribosylglycohydrolase